MHLVTRRKLLHTGTFALVGTALTPRLLAEAPAKKLFSAMGIAAPLDKAAIAVLLASKANGTPAKSAPP